MRVRLFKSGKDFDDWAKKNCDRCAVPSCPLLKEIIEGQTALDKSVSPDTAKSLGWKNGSMGPCRLKRRPKPGAPKKEKPYKVFGKGAGYEPW